MKLRQGVWILCFIALAAEASDAISPKRVVELDEKALWAKKSAAHALANVARKSAGTSREPSLLLRLAEMNEDIASIQYRLAFAKAPGRSGADLSGYTTSLNMALAPLNRLITQYPGWTGIPRAYYLRSKALEETGRTAAAIEDLKRLVQTWPASGDAPVANMELWRLLIQQKDYAVAIQYINRYGLRPSDKHYHAVLEKLSWCHFYLGMMAEALRYTEVELRTARGVEREKALSNYALFMPLDSSEKSRESTPLRRSPVSER